MNNLEQFPCYDYQILNQFEFQTITPVSVTIPYDKMNSGSKLIKKKVKKDKGDLVAYTFNLHETPNVSDGTVLLVKLLEKQVDVEVLTSFQHVFKGHRVFSIICQIQ
ncbi:TPA: hypothetical protein I4G69_001341 [Enterobacter asburiae]|uniref:hypothetical protein n=1 Tax=Enterobacter hormaechei TaxID=158836 RepID=UPI000665E819|nr:hypothetical protein [Enterobacter hormaechei]HDR2890509.1 hypothetical protein [Enterobacter asburiae]